MKHWSVIAVLSVSACLFLLQCSISSGLAGGTDMPNESTITASIRDTAGNPVAGARVVLVPADYVVLPQISFSTTPPRIARTTTDTNGRFSIDSLDSGTYSIEVNDLHAAAFRIRCTIGPKPDTIMLGTRLLIPYATIVGTIDTAGTQGQQLCIQIYGLDRLVGVNSNGTFRIDSLPADTFSMRLVSTNMVLTPRPLRQIVAASGTITPMPMPTWRYSRTLTLNTTSTGADVTGTVTGFPVLVRLSSSNFPFAQARPGGEDVRFVKLDGTSLPYDIERWDAPAGQAELWVKIDTLYGNNGTQAITLCWGNSDATDASKSVAVFDTANGFSEVYHLNQASGGAQGATSNALHGAANGAIQYRQPGSIGYANSFSSDSDFFDAGNSPEFLMNKNMRVTISAWVKRAGPTQYLQEGIAGRWKWVGSDCREYAIYNKATSGFEFWISSDGTQGTETSLSAGVVPVDGEWYHITGCMDGAAMKIYINGVEKNAATKTTIFGSTNAPFRIGYLDGNVGAGEIHHFNGTIDEVRVENVSRSADWIKLCYMNQKEGDALIRW